MCVLIVEDESAARRGLANLLEQLGVNRQHILTAPDGKQGLAEIRAHAPALAFVDIRMPVMNGLQMIGRARELDSPTSFVLTSAYSEFEYAREAVHLGVKEFLVKPIDPEEVEQVLAAHYRMPEEEEDSPCHPMVRRMLRMMETDYAKPLNLSTLSDDLGLTPEYLSYLFRRDMGITFSTHLRRVRIEHALELMQSGENRIGTVANAVGFSDTKYFFRVFREVTGQSPSSYLKDREDAESPE